MKTQYQQYWTEFKGVCDRGKPPLKLDAPQALNKIGVNLGPNLGLKIRVEAVVNPRLTGVTGGCIAVRVSVSQEVWKTIDGDITETFDCESQLQSVENEKSPYNGGKQVIFYKTDVDVSEQGAWADQFEWFITNLSLLAEAFRSRFRPEIVEFVMPDGKRAIKGGGGQQTFDLGDDSEPIDMSREDLRGLRELVEKIQELLAKYD